MVRSIAKGWSDAEEGIHQGCPGSHRDTVEGARKYPGCQCLYRPMSVAESRAWK